MKKIKAITTIHHGVRGKSGVEVKEYASGTVFEVEGDEAERLVRIGAAEFVTGKDDGE